MDDTAITSRLITIIRPYVNAGSRETVSFEKLSGNEQLKVELKIDSVDIIEIILEIEKTFGIQVEDERLKEISTLNDLIRIIREKKTAADFVSAG